ncbi:XRE family transcriptional regulator [uncultured Roseibium sp.]|uniref:helix-turn-helix domain-containing protein n=1 Tax=uncultured Roseibium sp. TaxID=1936171 RepID=UPI0032166994
MRNDDGKPVPPDAALAARLTRLRQARGWSLEELAEQSGISRASLSRIERGETSPTAHALGQLAAAYQMPMAAFFSGLEDPGEDLVSRSDQQEWSDPQTGFRRRNVSPARTGYKGSLIEGRLPAGREVTYSDAPIPGLEHHLLLRSGRLEVVLGEVSHLLEAGDCLRFKLTTGNSYRALGPEDAHYILCVITP